MLGDESLLQNTLRRLEDLPLAPPIVVINQEYRFITAEQLRQLGLERWDLLLEPGGRNTAPALTAALYATRDGADSVLLAAVKLICIARCIGPEAGTMASTAAKGFRSNASW